MSNFILTPNSMDLVLVAVRTPGDLAVSTRISPDTKVQSGDKSDKDRVTRPVTPDGVSKMLKTVGRKAQSAFADFTIPVSGGGLRMLRMPIADSLPKLRQAIADLPGMYAGVQADILKAAPEIERAITEFRTAYQVTKSGRVGAITTEFVGARFSPKATVFPVKVDGVVDPEALAEMQKEMEKAATDAISKDARAALDNLMNQVARAMATVNNDRNIDSRTVRNIQEAIDSLQGHIDTTNLGEVVTGLPEFAEEFEKLVAKKLEANDDKEGVLPALREQAAEVARKAQSLQEQFPEFEVDEIDLTPPLIEPEVVASDIETNGTVTVDPEPEPESMVISEEPVVAPVTSEHDPEDMPEFSL